MKLLPGTTLAAPSLTTRTAQAKATAPAPTTETTPHPNPQQQYNNKKKKSWCFFLLGTVIEIICTYGILETLTLRGAGTNAGRLAGTPQLPAKLCFLLTAWRHGCWDLGLEA